MKHFEIVKEADMPIDVIPSPAIWVNSARLKDLFEQIKQAVASDVNTPIILQIRRGDRYELRMRFQRIVQEKVRLGKFNYADSSDINDVLRDTNPYPTVMIDGGRFPRHAQARFVRMMKSAPDTVARLVVLTEADPGDLRADGYWSEDFRMVFARHLRWPLLTERDLSDTNRILMEFLKDIQADLLAGKNKVKFKLRRRGVELIARTLYELEPDSVHRLRNAAKKAVRDLLADGVTELSETTVHKNLLVPSAWGEIASLPLEPQITTFENVRA